MRGPSSSGIVCASCGECGEACLGPLALRPLCAGEGWGSAGVLRRALLVRRPQQTPQHDCGRQRRRLGRAWPVRGPSIPPRFKARESSSLIPPPPPPRGRSGLGGGAGCDLEPRQAGGGLPLVAARGRASWGVAGRREHRSGQPRASQTPRAQWGTVGLLARLGTGSQSPQRCS